MNDRKDLVYILFTREEIRQLVLDRIIESEKMVDLYTNLFNETPPTNRLAIRILDSLLRSETYLSDSYMQFYVQNYGAIPQYNFEPEKYSSLPDGVGTALEHKIRSAEYYRKVLNEVEENSTAHDLFQASLLNNLEQVSLLGALLNQSTSSETSAQEMYKKTGGILMYMKPTKWQKVAINNNQIQQIILQELFVMQDELNLLQSLIKVAPSGLSYRILQSIMVNLNNQISNFTQYYNENYGMIPLNTVPPYQFTNFEEGLREAMGDESNIVNLSRNALVSLDKNDPAYALLLTNMIIATSHLDQYAAIFTSLYGG